ncbi:hypothetical protein CBM2615_B60011 [Cupriavidus taiwanensis]|uniref:Uncharacterized protein n=1 Tax=Cupriavidus taiwanensis TaxID=164546 RepID=A0A375E9K0_9BURK|nr:hypothetical protein CBM2614_B50012 [Cupriavidus taiwanensis]SOZ69650.1 hypothetical protein CBM2615_B60011 [Cupriavidus taiwanensis]SOZ72863.1 hypothetical protein CBM2613_B50011 [Cupriavidus taiwanensis]SPA09722.1 hypothetical protein CBM2625_B50011 [Cupriavidus taiwanensis]
MRLGWRSEQANKRYVFSAQSVVGSSQGEEQVGGITV